ncbi:MAG: hypothetical protein MUE52_04225 [Tabrizicola sp.]|jgi:hypothetical protein|nr:hypothetical protein [Tabrizicola sp.]
MNAPVIDLTRRMVAQSERARLAGFLHAAAEAERCATISDSFDTSATIDSRAARDAAVASLVADETLLRLARDPGLATFLGLILEQLNGIAEGRL